MAKSEQQRQKKLAKKRTKERLGRRALAQNKQQMASLAGQMQAASGGEVYGCYMPPSDSMLMGMATVYLARRMSGGRLAVGFFLIDTYCLGVKDAGGRICPPQVFEEMIDKARQHGEMRAENPSTARKFVEDAIAYAHSIGFPPHPDYRKVAPIWGDIDTAASDEEFEFGRNGKPFYVAGPHDDPQRQTFIFRRLSETVGEGNFDFALSGELSLDSDVVSEELESGELRGGTLRRIEAPELE